jgi:integrase
MPHYEFKRSGMKKVGPNYVKLRKKAKGIYQVRFTINGITYGFFSTKTTDVEEAKREAHRLYTQKEHDQLLKGNSLSNLIESYLLYKGNKGKDDKARLQRLLKIMGDKWLHRISSEDCIKAYDKIKSTYPLSDTSLRAYLITFKMLFNYGQLLSKNPNSGFYVPTNPFSDVYKKGAMPRYHHRERYISDAEMLALLKHTKSWLKDAGKSLYQKQFFYFLLLADDTGCRKREVLHIKWSELEPLNNDWIRFKVASTISKTREPRYPVMTKSVYNELQNIQSIPDYHLTEYVFDLKRRASDVFYDLWSSVCKELKIVDANIHDIRHRYCTNYLKAGTYINWVAKQVGDDVKTMLSIYSHLLDVQVKPIQRIQL